MAWHASGRALALGVGALLVGAPVGVAATVSAFPEPTYTAAEGERNHVTIADEHFSAFGTVRFGRGETGGAAMSDGDGPGTGCEPVGGSFVCPMAEGATVHATLGDERDFLEADFLELGVGDAPPVTAQGGRGGDWIFGGAQRDAFMGEDGHDELVGEGGDDQLDGGPGDDVLNADGEYTRGSDRVDGGGGDDWVDGGAGDDQLGGGDGYDHVIAGDGTDTVDAGPGRDLVESGDGGRDVVACGDGADTLRADAIDEVAADCERVTEGTGPVPRAELHRDLRADLRAITRALSRMSLRELARRRTVAHRFTPLTSGMFVVTWAPDEPRFDQLGFGTLASGTVKVVGLRPAVLHVKIKRSARRQFRRADRLRLRAWSYFYTTEILVRVGADSPFTVTR